MTAHGPSSTHFSSKTGDTTKTLKPICIIGSLSMRDKRRKPHNWEVINLRKFLNSVLDFHRDLRNEGLCLCTRSFGCWNHTRGFQIA